ncbi:hypothetical protein Tco_1394461 [Tanacetum coccineum]
MIATSSSRYSSNDIVHNHYLEEAKKKTQEHSRNSRNFSDVQALYVARHVQKSVLMLINDSLCTKFQKKSISGAKVPSNKTTNRNKPVEQIRVATKPERQIPTGHRPRSSMFKRRLIIADQASVFMEMMSVHISSGLVFHQMMSDHNSSDLAPQRQEMSVENVSSGLVPQGQKASDYDNFDHVPPRQNVAPTAEKTDSLQQGLELLFSPLLEEYYNPAYGHDEDNNNDQAPNASFSISAEFNKPFVTQGTIEIGEEGIDFEESIAAPVARLEAFRNFVATQHTHIQKNLLLLRQALYVIKQLQDPSKMELFQLPDVQKALLKVSGEKLGIGCQRNKTALQYLQQRQSTWRYLQVVLKSLVRRIGMRCLTPAELEVLTNETA